VRGEAGRNGFTDFYRVTEYSFGSSRVRGDSRLWESIVRNSSRERELKPHPLARAPVLLIIIQFPALMAYLLIAAIITRSGTRPVKGWSGEGRWRRMDRGENPASAWYAAEFITELAKSAAPFMPRAGNNDANRRDIEPSARRDENRRDMEAFWLN
jgi:hypothetical protein